METDPPPEPSSLETVRWFQQIAVWLELSGEQELRAWAEALDCPFLDTIEPSAVQHQFVQQVPIGFCRQHQIIAIDHPDHGPILVYGQPSAGESLSNLERHLGLPLALAFSTPATIQNAINLAFERETDQTQRVLRSLQPGGNLASVSLGERADLLDTDGQAPVVRLVNSVLFEAVQARASDIHVQPYESETKVRYRIDGVLFDVHVVPKTLQEEMLSRLKVLGGMNIAEKRLPQDGRASVKVGERAIDLRIASLPTNFGERIVIRLLDKSARVYRLPDLGYRDEILVRLQRLVQRDHGMILVTGPTGSGKSTTLYAALQEIDASQLNVVTIEDPIEYQLNGISQTQVNVKKGLTFASGLRSVLRQDPDIILVGEIRDRETAEMAIQSALTGHLVLSTLHTNDAASAITRLLDLGIEPYLAASCLVGILAQRLVRKNCPACKTLVDPPPEDLFSLGLSGSADKHFYAGIGCRSCRGTGYLGRFAVCELLTVSESIRDLIQRRATASEILTKGASEGLTTMREDGIRRVLAGETTCAEVARVTVGDLVES